MKQTRLFFFLQLNKLLKYYKINNISMYNKIVRFLSNASWLINIYFNPHEICIYHYTLFDGKLKERNGTKVKCLAHNDCFITTWLRLTWTNELSKTKWTRREEKHKHSRHIATQQYLIDICKRFNDYAFKLNLY